MREALLLMANNLVSGKNEFAEKVRDLETVCYLYVEPALEDTGTS